MRPTTTSLRRVCVLRSAPLPLRLHQPGKSETGNWDLGRAGHGGQGWMTYSFSPRNQVQLGYRLQQVSKDFIGGGRSVDLFCAS